MATDPWLVGKEALEASINYTRKHCAALRKRIEALEAEIKQLREGSVEKAVRKALEGGDD